MIVAKDAFSLEKLEILVRFADIFIRDEAIKILKLSRPVSASNLTRLSSDKSKNWSEYRNTIC